MCIARTLAGITFAILAATWAVPSHASLYQGPTGLTVPGTTITFDEFAVGNGTAVTTQYASLGATFAGLYNTNRYNGAFPNVSGSELVDFNGSCPCGPTIQINFTAPVTDAVFVFVSNPGTSTFTSYLGATEIESASLGTGSDGQFAGFTNSLFDTIIVTVGGNGGAGLVDNLEFNTVAVPEPASLALIGAGLLGSGLIRRKRV